MILINFIKIFVRFSSGILITDTKKFTRTEKDDTYTLIIKNVQEKDCVEYTINAKNEAGEVNSSCIIILPQGLLMCL